MSNGIKEKLCPMTGFVHDLIEDLVFDHPWLWTGGALFVGLLTGRSATCNCSKKVEH
ncbi:hypothetical protein GS501_07140 [Saccharibacter sp. 17.LH.SD]|uniref:hypothetical protein n=1 Tax=Saccharibacter sp. 17.LH.SD TaxID=2689393 RepID=UPI00136DAA39|nr:hypothetical protein [Saccharibacter sp. 17.LH.SD]MXV44811.1 hypothetical protein [Saccharibacter sp. 17.LH.SD]